MSGRLPFATASFQPKAKTNRETFQTVQPAEGQWTITTLDLYTCSKDYRPRRYPVRTKASSLRRRCIANVTTDGA